MTGELLPSAPPQMSLQRCCKLKRRRSRAGLAAFSYSPRASGSTGPTLLAVRGHVVSAAACWWRAELMAAARGSLDYRAFTRLRHQPQLHAAVGALRGRGFSHHSTLGGKWGPVSPVQIIYTGLLVQVENG